MSEPKHSIGRHRPEARRPSTDRMAGTVHTSRHSTRRTQEIDRHVGASIRERRIMLGLPQKDLADLLGLSSQQVQKYERGINRISAGRLLEIAEALRVPIDHFFDGLPEDDTRLLNIRERMCLDLARTIDQIPDRHHREALSRLVQTLASA